MSKLIVAEKINEFINMIFATKGESVIKVISGLLFSVKTLKLSCAVRACVNEARNYDRVPGNLQRLVRLNSNMISLYL
ncbi:hypothetical protein AMJ80_10385 [bacterium SM23_31]|nr:MAG: hypothetical protein AMJ80_10385 [bacterium SM23_31]